LPDVRLSACGRTTSRPSRCPGRSQGASVRHCLGQQAILADGRQQAIGLETFPRDEPYILRKAAKKPAAPTSEANKEVMATRSPAEQNRVAATPAPAPTEAVHGTGGIGLDDILTAKALVERVGAEQLRSLIEVLAR
jgi:hypothetical protein